MDGETDEQLSLCARFCSGTRKHAVYAWHRQERFVQCAGSFGLAKLESRLYDCDCDSSRVTASCHVHSSQSPLCRNVSSSTGSTS
jgi:hypothetical protein